MTLYCVAYTTSYYLSMNIVFRYNYLHNNKDFKMIIAHKIMHS